ncbi:MAG: DUF5678 domain-containing protein [Blastocatellia bacterium]
MTTLEQVIAAVQTLPPADRRSLRQWLQEQERCDAAATAEQPDNEARPAADAPLRSAETVEQQIERFRKALKWIDEHRADYLGQWVALEGDRLISHGPDALQVHREAKAAGIAAPFVERIVEQEGPYWGGWL